MAVKAANNADSSAQASQLDVMVFSRRVKG
jgi:hypothetical protein